ncbi:PaaX domain-containing protein, C- domain protein [Gordonia sp. TBRC 11910]|uniref:PaaX domain-containing protein, C- domain protein n=1 Tax=Gordonia asplenii TaxID=2725283 RepID=A0A848KY17_9ACTN|nr:PaaX family transcriptional regulator C-terminal domain-containing protein [Gordonia asplenii]NMO03132.1 PaaX domain-containing protein, C- domain protein [Gordonia asplenii]
MPDAAPPRRLSARSAILSALLGAHPGEATTKGIIAIGAGLGYSASTVRVALTRMVAAGDLERTDGVYRLARRLVERQRRQDEALEPAWTEWTGRWRMVVVTTPALDAAERVATREALLCNHFGELREGVWMRPDNLAFVVGPVLAERVRMFATMPDADSVELARELFDPTSWADLARKLLAELDAASSLAERFVAAAAVVGHLLRDPLLPAELCPQPWPGELLRAAYRDFRDEFTAYVGTAM